MSTTSTSIGADGATGGNENRGSDGCGNKTLGEQSSQVPAIGKPLPDAGARPRPTDGAAAAGEPSQSRNDKEPT